MENSVFSALELHAYGLHESLACRLAIARVHVNVLAPQTLWTVIGVTAPAYKETAPFTGEVFFGTLEFLGSHHRFFLHFFGC
jgi:NAD(P)-dependent dehydrogenase (short-subunit alcohol dehydrogenase family)